MAISILAAALKALFEMDHMDTYVAGDNVVYVFKTTGFHPALAKIKAVVLSMLDLPADWPLKVEVEELKKGIITREYLVRIWVPRSSLERLKELAKEPFKIPEEIARPFRS